MTPGKRPGNPRRAPGRGPGQAAGGSGAVDFWAVMPQLEKPEPIEPADDPTALLRSLGPPPLIPGSERQVAIVAERASVLATALAMTADILAASPEGDSE